MKTSVIRQRVADFLKQYPPFDALSESDLLELAGSGRVKFHQAGEYLARRGDAKAQFLWVVQQGRVELLDDNSASAPLRDVLGDGDILGLDRFAGDGVCLYSARTASDVILYGLAAPLFETMVSRYPSMRRYLAAQNSASGNLGSGRTSWLDAEAPSLDFLRARLLAIPMTAPAAEVALQAAAFDIGVAALIDERRRAVGLITPQGSGPCPAAIAAPLTIRGTVRTMLEHRTEVLAITADSTLGSSLDAIVTASDLALFCGRNPMRLANAIRRARSTTELAPLWKQAGILVQEAMAEPADIDDCLHISTSLSDALLDACIRLGSNGGAMGPCCWILLGESARGSLPSFRLPTLAAIHADIGAHADSDKLTAQFRACGFEGTEFVWPENCGPSMALSKWTQLFSDTIRNPFDHDLYARRELFDLRPVAGDHSIFQMLQDHLTRELLEHELIVPLLANDTLAKSPPLTFFHGLVLELDGEQRQSFNIDEVALLPIAAAARVFGLAKGHLTPAGTLERLEAASRDFPDGAETFREAAGAYRVALYYRAISGEARIDPAKLGKFDQLLLKRGFSAIQRLLALTASTFIPAS